MQHAKQSDIALLIDTALYAIEKNNEQLKGALPDNYYSRLNLDTSKLASLLDVIDGIELTADKEQDVIGRVYEYFLSKFALKEGKGKGEFYTPKSIVNLIAEMLEPYSGILYDETVPKTIRRLKEASLCDIKNFFCTESGVCIIERFRQKMLRAVSGETLTAA